MKVLEALTQLCTGVWVGSMAGFAFTAPQIFRAFGENRQAAGDLAGDMIWRLNVVGMALGAVALLALLPRLAQRVHRWRAGMLVLALGLAAVGAVYIFPQMAAAQPPHPIQEYTEHDPIRVHYNLWHERSRQVFSGAILLGAGALILGAVGKETR